MEYHQNGGMSKKTIIILIIVILCCCCCCYITSSGGGVIYYLNTQSNKPDGTTTAAASGGGHSGGGNTTAAASGGGTSGGTTTAASSGGTTTAASSGGTTTAASSGGGTSGGTTTAASSGGDTPSKHGAETTLIPLSNDTYIIKLIYNTATYYLSYSSVTIKSGYSRSWAVWDPRYISAVKIQLIDSGNLKLIYDNTNERYLAWSPDRAHGTRSTYVLSDNQRWTIWDSQKADAAKVKIILNNSIYYLTDLTEMNISVYNGYHGLDLCRLKTIWEPTPPNNFAVSVPLIENIFKEETPLDENNIIVDTTTFIIKNIQKSGDLNAIQYLSWSDEWAVWDPRKSVALHLQKDSNGKFKVVKPDWTDKYLSWSGAPLSNTHDGHRRFYASLGSGTSAISITDNTLSWHSKYGLLYINYSGDDNLNIYHDNYNIKYCRTRTIWQQGGRWGKKNTNDVILVEV
jgi:hypothetical protein